MNLFIDKIPGQKRVKKTLNNFLQYNKIPHAFLFTGKEGVGKDNAAIQFAKAITQNSNLSGSDKAVKAIDQLQEPFFKIIFPIPRGKNENDSSSPTEKLTQDEIELLREQLTLKSDNPFHKLVIPKANTIKINSIREIKKILSMNYDETGYRFILISDAHLMNEEAQNSLLKNLEEPPDHVIFILTTSLLSKLKHTIISRCWKINFDPLTENEIVEILIDYFNVDKASAEEVAPFAMGSVQSALNLLAINFTNLKEKTISILRYSFGRKFKSAIDELNTITSDQNSDHYKIIISMIMTWVTDVQRYRLENNQLYFKEYLETIEKFNNKFPDVSINDITSKLDKLSKLYDKNINPTLININLIFELASVVLNKS